MNWERVIPPELADHLAGRGLIATNQQALAAPRFSTRQDDQSWNHPAMGAALLLCRPVTASAGLDSLLVYQDACRSIGYEGQEPGSRTYGHMTCGSMLMCLRELRARTKDGSVDRDKAAIGETFLLGWLAYWWARERACLWETEDGPRSLRCGARSQGRTGRLLSDYALSLSGISSSPWRWVRGQDVYWISSKAFSLENVWFQIFTELAAEIRETAASKMAVPIFPLLIEQHILRTPAGLAVWCEAPTPRQDSIPNNNTVAMAGMGWMVAEAEPWALPPGGGDHIRAGEKIESCWREGGELVFSGRIAGEDLPEVRQALPSGPGTEIIYWRDGRVETRVAG